MKLEALVIPVSDVDRAKKFWKPGVEARRRPPFDNGLRIVQFTLAIAWQLEARLDRALNEFHRLPANQRLAIHLLCELQAIFIFLDCPWLDVTNYRAEHAIVPW